MLPTKTVSAEDFLKRAVSVAHFYNFEPRDQTLAPYKTRPRRPCEFPSTSGDMFSREIPALIKACSACEFSELNNPLYFYYIPKGRASAPRFALSVLGLPKSVAEALALQAAVAVLSEAGHHDVCIHINSIGDRDSAARYVRELTNFLRKYIGDLPEEARERMKTDVFSALSYLVEEEHELSYRAPRPLQYLSDGSRTHLGNVLEFLESAHIPYEIDDKIVPHKDWYTQTVFEIRKKDDDAHEDNKSVTLARGGRCDEATRRVFRTPLPSVGIILEHPATEVKKGAAVKRASHEMPNMRKKSPRLYFVQLGWSAKLLSLVLMEELRRARIPVHQMIGSDSLGDQLERARDLSIPYALIMGQREAIDKTVIVRDMATQTQQTIPMERLSFYLKQELSL